MLKILIAILVSFNTLAAWSPEAKKDFSEMQGLISYKGKDFVTLWGSIRRFVWSSSLKGEQFKVKLPELEKELPLYAFKAQGKKPLVIFFPGIFGSHEGEINHWNANEFEKSNMHLGIVPNFLNKHYIAARPKYSNANALSIDVKTALDAAQKIIQRIGEENIEKVVFVAESLGTFIASSSISYKDKYPGIFNRLDKVILLWPPLDIRHSLAAFDEKFKKTAKADQECSYLLKIPMFFKHYFWQEYPENVAKDDAECFGAFLFHAGFKNSIDKSFKAVVEVKGDAAGKEPSNFSELVNAHNPSFIESINNTPEKVRLSYWMDKWKGQNVDVKIISSKDDFINDPVGWDAVEGEVLFDWGGHCAPLSLESMQKTLAREAK
ncbi:MAG: hypothetical protein CME64_11780 [Halobacteriovoraceae bacterium]|nr:hypothetical protein [Halobacteriovoraceae bacterium]|tara:strand:+ start:103169 stop:104305 length:1137 start_codon:yes stop_codon:yes gene_type:complete